MAPLQKDIGSKKASDELSLKEQGSSGPSTSSDAFSVSIVSPFETIDDSKWKLALFIESLRLTYGSTAKSFIFTEAQKINENLNPKVDVEDIIEIYNTIVIYGRSYTKTDFTKDLLEDKNSLKPSLSFSELMEQSFPKARYTIEPFFEQGTVNMVSAPPNTWKSWLLFLCSAHIAEGTDLFDRFPVEKAKVMIVNEEDSFRAIQDRFKILGITDTALPIHFRVANGSKFESKFVDKLLDELKEKQIGVVIFDSLRAMHDADENDSTAMQKILDQMKRISRENITVIFTHHHRKKGMFEKGSSAESSRGSSAINAAISGHISLDEEERDTGLYLVIRHLKSKAGEKLPPFEVKILKEEGKVIFRYDGEFKASEKKLKQTKDQIMEILSDGKWKNTKDFEEKFNVSKSIMRQALTILKNEGMIISITRTQAIKKLIPVAPKGNARELYYALNTENAEAVSMSDEIVAQREFDEI